ncbi:zinc finger protein 62 homolog [Nymphalis io]|uniref:zinc finger protein 62 homolog n=1 Tax=Inachis io TaxID=171585 RepID=UPI00216A9E01|nr:zinc finger protein 62 homolog [Nymphalis io]
MILIVMEVVEEENPLQFYEVPNNVPNKLKNCVGRPKKKSEIKFSPQPKSIISILLSKEKSNAENHKDFKNEIKNGERNESMNKDSSERAQNYKSISNEQNIEFQKDKLYECNYCDCTYSTKFPSNLKTHKRIHTTEQRYICDECTFRSKFISSLKTHKRLHKDERPFACQCCDYKCNSRSNLKKHVTRKHINKNNDNKKQI